jgi:hypothetical protein
LLVQRLDAVLGTQLAQHGNGSLATRPDAVSPPGGPAAPGDQRTGGSIDPNSPQAKAIIRDAELQAALAAAARARYISTDTTRSAPTSLGQTARTILTLLAQYPETAPAVAGKAALWLPDGEESHDSGTTPRASGESAARPAGSASVETEQAVQGAGGGNAGQGGLSGQSQGGAGNMDAAPAPGTSQAGVASLAPDSGDAVDAAVAADIATNKTQATAAAGDTAGSKILDAASGRGPAGSTAIRAPDLPTPGPQPAGLAQALKFALQSSGLFYESHLGDVAYGQRTAAQLAKEPQAALDPGQAPRINPAGENRSILADNVRFSLPTSAAPMMSQADGMPSTGTAPTWSGSQPSLAPAPPPGIHPEAALLVRQQLEVLANQTLAWEGTAWPGTPMWWEVSREQHDSSPGAARPGLQTWATRLVLTMPRLGSVEARLSLAGDQLVMQIVAPDGDAEISRATGALRERMQAAGLTLSDVAVSAYAPGLEETL